MTEKPSPFDDAVAKFGDRKWRLNNLYWIKDRHGNVVKFKLNPAQEQLLDELHTLNIILKARQLGFSTFILILALDCCLFNSHFAAGLIADTQTNAQNLLDRIKFAYERLPAQLQELRPVVTQNATEIEFGNGSGVEVGVSLRSSTKNFLHISEYGKVCAKNPDRAKEIKTGSLNTVAPGQLVFIESTAEGRSGDFFDKCETSKAARDMGAALGLLEYRFHFFPWFLDDTYRLSKPVKLTPEEEKYFDELLAEHGIDLDEEQEWWYAAKAREQGTDMWREFPTTPDEAFKAAKDGAYWAKEIAALRQRGEIRDLPFETRTPVNTFWDLGVDDSTSIWLHQLIAGKHRFVGFIEASGEGIAYYLDELEKWRVRHGATFGQHYGPHDVEHRMQGEEAESIRDIAARLGFHFTVVERTKVKLGSIQAVRTTLPKCQFSVPTVETGLNHLEQYSRDWDEKHGVWKSQPRHDEHSHGADAFMTFVDGWNPPPKKAPKHKGPRVA
ncbi:terminase [Leisingera sp. NJS204]|nr:terminase [Leisingera sp. NJS204]